MMDFLYPLQFISKKSPSLLPHINEEFDSSK